MLRVTDLSKTFASTPVLLNFSLHLNPSEILFLVGPSGVGKSTALRLIANLDPFDKGKITLNDRTREEIGFAQWRADVMYVPQYRISYNGTPAEMFAHLLTFRSHGPVLKSEDRVQEYVEICVRMGLEKVNVAAQRWSELSGGQAQRATVALCVASRPKVLLLDEPSSSCDPASADLMEKVIKSSGIAAVWVTHDVGQPIRVGGRVQRMGGDDEISV